jgi:outer membrane receptor protein involved in Fe transport
MRRDWAGAAVAALFIVATPGVARAQTADLRSYNIPEQDLATALKAFAAASGREVVAPSATIEGKRSGEVVGQLPPEQAIQRLLAGTGLSFRIVEGAFIVRPTLAANVENTPPPAEQEIVVTGTRIRGAPIASPIISIDQRQIRDQGETTLGEVVRNIPQSFGGGQNPGIGLNVPALNGVDVGGGSSLNLRGLGSDATLTLLNGHRLAYSGSRQSIDVSTIPLGALDHIEIVPDGASALYGSDAVGGVANIILKRDLDGAEVRGRLGGSTDGGNFEQQYSATGGARWSNGGFIAAYEFNRNTAVEAADRDYAATRSPGLTLYPAMHSNNALISGHQDISTNLEFSVDALFNDRKSITTIASNPAGDLSVSRRTQHGDARAFAVAPQLALSAGPWNFALSGTHAEERIDLAIDFFTGEARTLLAKVLYRNGTDSVELAGDGPLISLPAGRVKLALGAGYRNTTFANDRGAGSPLNFSRSQANRYAYGELSIPIVAPDMDIPALYWLNLSAAARHENYTDAGSITTPKLGLTYSPVRGLDLKASWGRSFRAPTLYQRFQPPNLTLLSAAVLGARGAPPGSTALYIQGGNPDLRPERATTWSVTASLNPVQLPGLKLEASYFDIDYVDRIVTPIGFITQSLSDPNYAAQVTRSPSQAMIAAILASGVSFVNGTGAPFDPAKVIAFVNNNNVNAGRQWAHGVDLLASYRGSIGTDEIALVANASYLVSHRRISVAQPDLPLAGILFNPPHWRGRASATWIHDGFSLNATANYTGKLSDTRFTPAVDIPDQARFDLTARYRVDLSRARWLRGLEITLGVENVFDARPPVIFSSLVSDTPYDSTNYSPLGRVVSIGIAASW